MTIHVEPPQTPTEVLRFLLDAFGQNQPDRASDVLGPDVRYVVNGQPLAEEGPAAYEAFALWLGDRLRLSGVDTQATLESASVATTDCLISGQLVGAGTSLVLRCTVSADVHDGRVNGLLLRFDPDVPALKTLFGADAPSLMQ